MSEMPFDVVEKEHIETGTARAFSERTYSFSLAARRTIKKLKAAIVTVDDEVAIRKAMLHLVTHVEDACFIPVLKHPEASPILAALHRMTRDSVTLILGPVELESLELLRRQLRVEGHAYVIDIALRHYAACLRLI